MLYLRMCLDKEGVGDKRNELRQEHREYLMNGGVRVVQAGPMCVSDTDDTNIGSFLIIEADSHEQAMRFHEGDPFTKAGLYDHAHVHRWDKHIG